ncbi:MAG: hypothetical protein K5756_08885 [Clostridiales bacterium]|nr:hypothetical protein [Clostridiales bacterium]
MKKSLKMQIKREMKVIKRTYKNALRSDTVSKFGEWIIDNYYLISMVGDRAVKDLKGLDSLKKNADGLPLVFMLCLEMCRERKLLREKDIEEYFQDKNLTDTELSCLPVMLNCALISLVFKGCQRGREDGAEYIEFAIRQIQAMPDIDFAEILTNLSPLEKMLDSATAGVYGNTDEAGRNEYKRLLKKSTAKRRSEIKDELVRIKELAAKRGTDIFNVLLSEQKHTRGVLLLITEAVLPVLLSVFSAVLMKNIWVAFVLFLPLWEVLRYPVDMIFMRGVAPSVIPRLELKNGVPEYAKTLITVSTLLPHCDKTKELKEHLAQLWLSNGDKNVKICLLADLKEAETPEKAEDKGDIDGAKRVIEELNKRFNGGFILAIRGRTFSETQGVFTGRERKRGAITQLISVIKGEKNTFKEFFGDISDIGDVKYILALDSDTDLPIDTVRPLVSAAIHPANRPVIRKGRVNEGYGIFAPNAAVELYSDKVSAFTRYMAGNGGVTLYDNLASERYQDLFREGIFAGKGLIDVDAFYFVMKDALPEEKILSHDILEGGYLRTAFVSDVQVTDGFPKRQTGYFSRLERWTRGDWQNFGFIFSRNPLNGLSRYKLFDNLRRTLTPFAAMLGILISAAVPYPASAVIALICVMSAAGGNILSFIRSVINGGGDMIIRTYYSGALPEALDSAIRGILLIVMLPVSAYVSLSAIIRAMWRSLVSKRKLLEWTTAAQSDNSKGIMKNVIACLPNVIFTVFLMTFGGGFHKLLGILFLLDLPFALFSDRENKLKRRRPDYFMTEKLTSYAAAMWRYFTDNCTEENNWLPPDNVQETPVFRVARRTSPTNIGLTLLCIFAAHDFGFIGSEEMLSRLDKTISVVESLEKWNGNLFNWYNTETLKPLEPRYVSTVDSGNFLCCLTTLKQGLKEIKSNVAEIKDLTARIDKLMENCDILPMYNKRRKLFHIGFDVSTGKLSLSYYDLFMSEARMTSYFAVARGMAEKKHWGMLGRTLSKDGRYTGSVSWTGTMFEYFMPYLFLPAPAGTLGYEALRFCLRCQRRRVQNVRINGKRIPWGISESGFYSFDRQLNYQYKAHGVQKLGLKQGLNSELVISPYSVFLAMMMIPGDALKNLKYLENLGMSGRCGFYEAVDFTRDRTGGQDFAVVRSYMVHHVAMSMLSTLNVLKDGILQKRFMSDDKMQGAQCLLREKIQSGMPIFKNIRKKDIPQPRERTENQVKTFENITPSASHIKLLTNGEWTLAISDVGTSMSVYGNVSILRHSEDILRSPQGIMAFIETKEGERIPLTNAADYQTQARQKATFYKNRTVHSVRSDKIFASMTSSVHSKLPCEQRKFRIKNLSSGETELKLVIYFEPTLTPHRDFCGHPAFHKLFVTDSFDEDNLIITFDKRNRSKEKHLALAVGFDKNVKFMHTCSREEALSFCTENGGVRIKSDFRPLRGNPDSCCALALPVKLKGKGSFEENLYLCAASTAEEAKNNLIALRRTGGIPEKYGGLEVFRTGGMEGAVADQILPEILYDHSRTAVQKAATAANNVGIDALWSMKISGDHPIIAVKINSENDISRCIPYAKAVRGLNRTGIPVDLILMFEEGGDYNTPILSGLRNAVKNQGCEQLIGRDAGIHIINFFGMDEEYKNAVIAFSSFFDDGKEYGTLEEAPVLYSPKKIYKSSNNVKKNIFTDENIIVDHNNINPVKPWCTVLANEYFGTLISDKSFGFTWAMNAQQNKLTPWSNDQISDNIGEQLFLELEGRRYNMISGSAAIFSTDNVRWTGSAGDIDFEVEVRVPKTGTEKDISISLYNNAVCEKTVNLIYYAEPVLGQDSRNSGLHKYRIMENGVAVSSPLSKYSGTFKLTADNTADNLWLSKFDFWGQNGKNEVFENTCAAVGKTYKIASGSRMDHHFVLAWEPSETAAENLKYQNVNSSETVNSITIKTEHKYLDAMINKWINVQILNARFYGRTGFCQCGGAWGFRDQLQDVSSMIMLRPELVRRHICRCAAVQFEEGDVLHWWHDFSTENRGVSGVRTRCSDDMLWLPYVTAEYVSATGDISLLNEEISYIKADELHENETERYFSPEKSDTIGTVYDHCMRAIERSYRLGEHDLPLIMGGDWNDGFNEVGIKGRGESVWLAQFMSLVFKNFAAVCEIRGDGENSEKLKARSRALMAAVDENAWDGDRYLRAFYDDGEPMGCRGATECAVDSLTQSFAVLADMPDMSRRSLALKTAVEHLADEQNGIIKLFSPPFDKVKKAGYIAAYPPGIRENGGQYTHGAVWLCIAVLENGMTAEGWRLLDMLNPMNRLGSEGKTRDILRYGCEVFAFTGDVYAALGIAGKGGWSLYTGSAAWYYRAVIEHLFGIKKRGNRLYITPKLPENFGKAEVNIKLGKTDVKIHLNGGKTGNMLVDGAKSDFVPIDDDSHRVIFE